MEVKVLEDASGRVEKRENNYYYEDKELVCLFFEENHTYWLGYFDDSVFVGVKQLISVTSLMKKYKLVKGYGNVPQYILKKKADMGTLVHKELEEYVKYGIVGFSDELQLFIESAKVNDINPISSEYIVYNDVVAGTVDLKCLFNGFAAKVDYKTTSSYDEEYLSWQLSIYNYLDKHKDEKLLCFHFNNGKLDIKEVPSKSDSEIEKLFDMERSGYVEPIEEENKSIQSINEMTELQQVNIKLLEIQKELDIWKEKQEALKKVLVEKMKENNIKSLKNEYFTITYVPETIRESISVTRLKAEMPEIAKQFTTQTKVAPSVRITLRKGENENV